MYCTCLAHTMPADFHILLDQPMQQCKTADVFTASLYIYSTVLQTRSGGGGASNDDISHVCGGLTSPF
jgi:hypothetical protein